MQSANAAIPTENVSNALNADVSRRDFSVSSLTINIGRGGGSLQNLQ